MSDPYKKAKAGRLTFKGGELAAVKSIEKTKKKKKKEKKKQTEEEAGDDVRDEGASALGESGEGTGDGEEKAVYTIDAAKRMKYEELFPVETKRFGYDPANKSRSGARTVEEALDDRVKKKADRYCK
ncbi:unnamed protein product [Spirodela intermedia]|uniref:Uncharacterized protein n=1 Tax=Spirodela intermedia TaxID=51605 RepID=A0A7I8KP43_SPIIN|nr:unnamed protein product [Spirodela intermedia]